MSAAKDFRIGNLADDVLCLTLELCGKDAAHTPRFPARFYDSLVKAIIGAALEIHEDVFLANEDREIGYGERRRLKARAEAKCVHLNHLIRVSEERGEITPEKFAERYFGWRLHALKGNTRNMVRNTDRRMNARLNQIGYQLRIVRHQGGKVHWRVVVEPLGGI